MRHLLREIETTIRYVRQSTSYHDFAIVDLIAIPPVIAGTFEVKTAGMLVNGNIAFTPNEIDELMNAFSAGSAEACQKLDIAGLTIVVRSITVHPVDTHRRSFLLAGQRLEFVLPGALSD